MIDYILYISAENDVYALSIGDIIIATPRFYRKKKIHNISRLFCIHMVVISKDIPENMKEIASGKIKKSDIYNIIRRKFNPDEPAYKMWTDYINTIT